MKIFYRPGVTESALLVLLLAVVPERSGSGSAAAPGPLREKELVNQGFSPEDAAQKMKEDQRNMLLIETAMGVIGSKAGGKPSAGATTGNKVVNPATNKIATDHIKVPSGKAPKTSTPNSIYEVSRADNTKSITYYDDKGRMFSREDYGQQKKTDSWDMIIMVRFHLMNISLLIMNVVTLTKNIIERSTRMVNLLGLG